MGSSKIRHFYDDYWVGEALPDDDPFTPRRVDWIAGELSEEARVLDLGCGRGRATALLRERSFAVTGLDISLRALRELQESEFPVDVVWNDIEQGLPFADEVFEGVYAAEVIEHLFRPDLLLAEIVRVLRPGGVLLVSTPYHGFWKTVAVAAVTFEDHFDPVGPHLRFFSEDSLRELVAAEGLETVSVRKMGRFPPFWRDMVLLARKPAHDSDVGSVV